MKNLTKVTGMTEQEIKESYLSKITMAKAFGLTEEDARQLVQESFKEALFGK